MVEEPEGPFEGLPSYPAGGVPDTTVVDHAEGRRRDRVALTVVTAVVVALAAGPRFGPPQSFVLSLGIPLPRHGAGSGLAPGSQWTLDYHGSMHGPGGQITTEVTSSAPGEVRFRTVSDTSITHRWMALGDSAITWRPVADGRTEVTLTMNFVRGLDPSWYFGPLEQWFGTEGAGYLLDSLVLDPPPDGH